MDHFFNSEGKIMQALSTLADLVLLNLITIACSLPVFTLGAAVTALYDAIDHLQREEGNLFSCYFRAFRAQFRQATLLWLVLFSALAALLYGLTRLLTGSGGSLVMVPLFLLAVWSMVLSWAFLLQAQFSRTAFHTLAYAFVCAVRFLPRTLCMTVLNLLPLAIHLTYPNLAMRFGFLWVLVYFSLAAYCNRKLLPELSGVIPQ
ncbi:MAG: YesL family protein [Oscillospiraceae bacterium]|nr:YesL family protein [Oscillospiraceae bacterium]